MSNNIYATLSTTTDGYESVYREESFTTLMTVIAATRRVIFLGFGFEDTHLLSGFEHMTRLFADPTLCHYAVKPFDDVNDEEAVRKEYRDKWNTEIVFYELTPDDRRGPHAGFLDVMDELAVAADRRYVPAVARAIPAITAPIAGADAIIERITGESLNTIRGNDV